MGPCVSLNLHIHANIDTHTHKNEYMPRLLDLLDFGGYIGKLSLPIN